MINAILILLDIHESDHCAICLEAEPREALSPCGHFCFCHECCTEVVQRNYGMFINCPICRGVVEDIIDMDRVLERVAAAAEARAQVRNIDSTCRGL